MDVEYMRCKWERREKQKENLREGDRLEGLGVDGRMMFRYGEVNLNSLSLG